MMLSLNLKRSFMLLFSLVNKPMPDCQLAVAPVTPTVSKPITSHGKEALPDQPAPSQLWQLVVDSCTVLRLLSLAQYSRTAQLTCRLVSNSKWQLFKITVFWFGSNRKLIHYDIVMLLWGNGHFCFFWLIINNSRQRAC